jgi:coiled-coil and C2 domain-containing protein 1
MNNTSKVKMLTRILKKYEQAITANKSNKEYDYESLPVPPGFSELPKKMTDRVPDKTIVSDSNKETKPQTSISQSTVSITKTKAPFKRTISINNKQLDYLLKRQKLFKEAAIESNKKGDTTQALDYLR